MPIPKRQHFIPRLHLQHFVGERPRGQVWTYDAQTGQARSAIPEETAVESHFYSIERSDGTMDTQLENYLALIEGRAAVVYEALLEGKIPEPSQARRDFSEFLALIYARTPAIRRMVAEGHSRGIQIMNYAYATLPGAFEAATDHLEKAQGKVMDDAQKARLRDTLMEPSGYVVEVPKEHTIPAILSLAEKLAPLFFAMKWSLAAPLHGFFVTSDNPLVREVDPATWHPIYGDGGFLNKTAVITFPLTPKRMLVMAREIEAHGILTLPRSHVEDLNSARAANSDRYLYAHIHHKRLVDLAIKFKDSRPGITTQGFGLCLGVHLALPQFWCSIIADFRLRRAWHGGDRDSPARTSAASRA